MPCLRILILHWREKEQRCTCSDFSTLRLLSLLHPAGLITSKRKKQSKQWQLFHGNNRARSIGCQHIPVPDKAGSGCLRPGLSAPCQQSCLLGMWLFHDQLFNLVLNWINNALHSCLKGQPTGNGDTPGTEQSLKHRRAACDGTGLTALSVHPKPPQPHRLAQECPARLPTQPAVHSTLHRAVSSSKAPAESSSSNTTPQTSFRDRQSSSCPLLQKDRIHFFCWSLKNKTCQIFQKQGREA